MLLSPAGQSLDSREALAYLIRAAQTFSEKVIPPNCRALCNSSLDRNPLLSTSIAENPATKAFSLLSLLNNTASQNRGYIAALRGILWSCAEIASAMRRMTLTILSLCVRHGSLDHSQIRHDSLRMSFEGKRPLFIHMRTNSI